MQDHPFIDYLSYFYFQGDLRYMALKQRKLHSPPFMFLFKEAMIAGGTPDFGFQIFENGFINIDININKKLSFPSILESYSEFKPLIDEILALFGIATVRLRDQLNCKVTIIPHY